MPDLENVTGSEHDDVIVGTSAANALRGGYGEDSISAGAGNDRIDGIDMTFVGGAHGPQPFYENAPDVIACGPGTDRVDGDAADTAASDCERVTVNEFVTLVDDSCSATPAQT